MHSSRTPMRLPHQARTVGISGPTSRLPNKFRLALAVLIAAAAPTTLTTIAAAETETNWVGDFDSWDQDANWDNSAPDAGVSATIDNGGTASVASPDSQAADVQVRDGGLRVGTGGSLTTPDDTRRSVVDGPTNASLDVNGQLSTGNNPLTVARDGNGRLVVRNGGHLSSGDDSRVADGGGTATVLLDGTESRWAVAGDLAIGDTGEGNAGVRLSNGGRIEAERIEADAEETQIIIGHSATSPVGLIAAEEIVGGTAGGSTELTFAHQADDYYFTDDGTADGEATAINGNVEVVADGQGRTTLAGENGYDQGTEIETATLSVRSDANLGDATGTLLINDGTLETTGSFTSRRATEIGAIGGTFHVQDGTTLTHEGTISGTGRLRKAGAGTLVLSGDNDYARTSNAERQTWITDGILSVAEDGHLGGAAGGLELDGGTLRTTGTFTTARTTTLASAASALEVANGTTLTHEGMLSGTGGLSKTGGGTLALSGSNDYTGGTRIERGTVAVSADDQLGADSGGLRLDGGALRATGSFTTARSTELGTDDGGIHVDANAALDHEGAISGNGRLIKTGDGELSLAGTNAFTGGISVEAGILAVSEDTGLGDANGDLRLDGGTLRATGSFATDRATTLTAAGGGIQVADDTTLTHDGALSGAGGLTKTGDGTLTLGGANDYTGGTTIAGGTVAVSTDDQLGADSGGLRLDGGALQATDSFTTARSTTLGAGGGIRVDESAAMVHEGAISGSGQLTKTGNGHLILAGTNNHTGGTTLSAGELTLRNGNALADSGALTIDGGTLNVDDAETVGTLSGDAGTINLADDLTAGDAADTTYAGAIVGDGGFRKTGNGTLTLSGENRHTGGTSIEAGAIVLRGGDALPDSGAVTLDEGRLGIATAETIGALTGAEGTTIDLGADLTAGDQNDTTVASTITGAGGLTKAGSGRVILSGTNDFTGGTSLSAGELVLRDGNALADGGGVTIDGGRLVIADAETIGTLEGAGGTIRLESDLTAGGAGDTAFAGSIQGTGGLRKTGEGSLTLSGQNDYAGGTGIEAGTLAVKGGNAIADDGSVVIDGGTFAVRDAETVGMLTGASESTVQLDADLTVRSTGNASYMGRMTGSGGFVKQGTGHLLLAGDSDHTGPTRVDAGRLTVNGSIEGSAVAVAGGATLGGDGTVGATTIENDGTLAPGNSIGTLRVDGDITLASASTYTIETDADGNSDRTEATGTATVNGGTVEVVAAGGDYASDTEYSILQADAGVTGTFDDTHTDLAFLDPSLGYNDNEVTLRLTRNDRDYASVAQTPNQRAVATALTDAAPGDGDEAASLTASIDTLDTAGARAAYDNLSGMQHTHASGAARQQNQRFMGLIRDRLGPGASAGATRGRAPVQIAFSGEDWGRMLAAGAASAPEAGARGDDGRGLWVRALGGNGEIDGTANATGADYTSAGLAIGADTRLDNGLIAGLAAGYGRTDSDTGSGDLDTDSYQIAGYAQWRKDGTYVDSRIGLGRHRTDAARSIVATDAASTATADYDADQFTWSLEGGHAWREWNNATITPFAGVDFNRNERKQFRERGAGAANLNVEEETWTSLRTRLGARMSTVLETGGGTTFEPRFELAWVREHADREAAITAHFDAAPASSFTVEGPELDRDRAAIGAGITARLDDTSRLDLEYRGDFADSDRHHGIALSWRTTW